MEEILIYKVKERRELYDAKLANYKDQKVRNQAWNEISAELGLSAASCREMWCKLRNAYKSTLKRRLSNGGQVPSPTKWKYEEIMSFLIPHIVSGNRERFDRLLYKEPSSPLEDDINYTIDETIVDTTRDDEEDNINNSKNEFTTSVKPSTSKDCTEKVTKSVSNNEESTSDDRNPELIHLKPKNCQKISVVSMNNLKDAVKIKKTTPDREIIDLTDPNFNVNISKRKNSEFTSPSYLTLKIKANLSKTNGSYDDAKEDEFYLRVAKMAKTLKISDRIKLRETVTNAVMEAMMQSQKCYFTNHYPLKCCCGHITFQHSIKELILLLQNKNKFMV